MANGWASATFACLAAAAAFPAHAAGDWDACIGAPTRACVLDLAAADVASIADKFDRAGALSRLALARSKAGFKTDAEMDFAAVAQALKADDNDPLPNYGQRPIMLGQLAGALAQAGYIDEAIRTVETIKIDDGSVTSALSAIAVAQAKSGKMDEAKQTIARALQGAGAMTYGKFLLYRGIYGAQLAAGLSDDAARTLGLERDAALAEKQAWTRDNDLQRIAADQATAGDIPSALKTVGLVQDAAQREFGAVGVLKAAIAADKIDEAMPIVDTLSGAERAGALLSVIELLAKAGRKAEAEATLAKARTITLALPEGPEKARGLVVLTAAERNLGDADAAAADMASAGRIFDGLAPKEKTDVTLAFAFALAKSGRVNDAMALVAAMPADMLRDDTYLVIGDALSQNEDFSGALGSMQRAASGDFRASVLRRADGTNAEIAAARQPVAQKAAFPYRPASRRIRHPWRRGGFLQKEEHHGSDQAARGRGA